jgi:protease-4
MFGQKVISLLPWLKKDEPQGEPHSALPGAEPASPEVTVAPAPAPEKDNTMLGQMNVSEFEQLLTRVEVAKKVAEVRETHMGINRNRVQRLVRALVLLAVGITAALLFPTNGKRDEITIDKRSAGPALPIAGAAAGASAAGHIAVIKIGEIDGDFSGPAVATNTPLFIATALAAAEADPDLAGVVLEINSPGGGVSPSAQSYRIVKAARERLAKRNIKMVAYTSAGAYSGGYWIAMGVGKGNFFADPATSVANIGVIIHLFNTAGIGEAFGVTENIIKTGPQKSAGSQWEKLTPDQRAMFQTSVDDSFEMFLEAVAEGRRLDIATLRQESQLPVGVGNGQWFSAKRALAKDLIDGIINVEDRYKHQATMLVDPRRFKNVEFVNYQAHAGILEAATKNAAQLTGSFLREFTGEMTRRDAPVRAEKP